MRVVWQTLIHLQVSEMAGKLLVSSTRRGGLSAVETELEHWHIEELEIEAIQSRSTTPLLNICYKREHGWCLTAMGVCTHGSHVADRLSP